MADDILGFKAFGGIIQIPSCKLKHERDCHVVFFIKEHTEEVDPVYFEYIERNTPEKKPISFRRSKDTHNQWKPFMDSEDNKEFDLVNRWFVKRKSIVIPILKKKKTCVDAECNIFESVVDVETLIKLDFPYKTMGVQKVLRSITINIGNHGYFAIPKEAYLKIRKDICHEKRHINILISRHLKAI